VIYVGSSEKAAVVRGSGSEEISVKDKKFDEMFCVFDRDMQTMLNKCLSKEAKVQTMDWFGESDK
jgi:hypothetical protein